VRQVGYLQIFVQGVIKLLHLRKILKSNHTKEGENIQTNKIENVLLT